MQPSGQARVISVVNVLRTHASPFVDVPVHVAGKLGREAVNLANSTPSQTAALVASQVSPVVLMEHKPAAVQADANASAST